MISHRQADLIFHSVIAVAAICATGNCLAGPDAADSVVSFRLPSGHKVQIIEAPFADSGLQYSDSTPCLVNGKIPFGTDCGRPSTYVKQLTVEIAGKKRELDVSQMFNAWGERPLFPQKGKKFRYFGGSCSAPDSCVFRGLFSDGAGAFVAEWRVRGDATTRTVITNDEELTVLLLKKIDAK